MAEQFEHIAGVADRARMITQVLPLNAGAHPFMIGTATLHDLRRCAAADVHRGLFTAANSSTIRRLVKRYARSYDLLRAAALSPEASLAMIEAAARDYRDDCER